jgi:hypothetical protein
MNCTPVVAVAAEAKLSFAGAAADETAGTASKHPIAAIAAEQWVKRLNISTASMRASISDLPKLCTQRGPRVVVAATDLPLAPPSALAH